MIALLLLVIVGCVSQPTVTDPSPTAGQTQGVELATLPLAPNVAGIPADDIPTASVEPHTPAGSVEVGQPQTFTLGHCGLISPIDMDGSLWVPTFGDDGAGGPLTAEHEGELINATPVELVLIDADTAQVVTPAGARIVLVRHDGPRDYALCD
jgi:hypothetical protein